MACALELRAPVRKNALFTDDLPLNAPPVRESACFTDKLCESAKQPDIKDSPDALQEFTEMPVSALLQPLIINRKTLMDLLLNLFIILPVPFAVVVHLGIFKQRHLYRTFVSKFRYAKADLSDR